MEKHTTETDRETEKELDRQIYVVITDNRKVGRQILYT